MPPTDNNLCDVASRVFWELHAQRAEFVLADVDGASILKSSKCKSDVFKDRCSACDALANIVDKAFYSKSNSQGGPIIKMVHADYILRSTCLNAACEKILRQVERDGPKGTFDAERFDEFKQYCLARLNFNEWLNTNGRIVTALNTKVQRSGKSLEDIFLLDAVNFLTGADFEQERKDNQVTMGLFRALCSKAHGAKRWAKDMRPEMREAVMDGLLNLQCTSPKATRSMQEVLRRNLPSERSIIRAKATTAKDPTVSTSGLHNPTEKSVFA